MALKATIFKAALQIADMDRNYYQDHALTIARHPSETDERMMVRVLAFALNAAAGLAFGAGLSAENEPDLWLKDPTGAIKLWIEVGLPDEKAIRRARGRSDSVRIYAYGGQRVRLWWDAIRDRQASGVSVLEVAPESSRGLAALAQRNMRLQCVIQDGVISITDGSEVVQAELIVLKAGQGHGGLQKR